MGANFRPDIEGLRGLAVLLVVVFHAGLGLPGGFIGVDVFFVISGFLITGLLLREREQTGRIDFLAFYARRIRRLLPAAVVVLLITLPIAYALFAPLDRGQMIWDGAASALSLGNIRFALAEGDYFANLSAPSPFLHFWSLGVEEQFYLVWPALLLLAGAVRRPRAGVGLALVAVFLASLAAAALLTVAAPNWAFYSLPTRAFELALGGLLVVGGPALARLPRALLAAAGWLGAAAVVVAAFTFDAGMPFPGTSALVPTLGAAALIAAGERNLGRWSPAAVMSVAPMRFLGRISYSLYLWHWPIFVLAGLLVGFGREPGLVVGLWLIGLSIGVSMLSWALVEEPFRRGFRLPRPIRLPLPQLRPATTVAAGLAGMLSVVLVANSLALAADSDLRQIGRGDSPDSLPVSWAPESLPPDDPDPDADAEDPTDPPDVILPDAKPTPQPGATPSPQPDPPLIMLPSEPPATTPRPDSTPRPDKTPRPTPRTTPAPTPRPTPRPTPSEWSLSADVQPALVDARADKERPWFDRCLGIEASIAPRAACSYGDPNGSYTIALVGDSHGSAMFGAMDWVARHNGWKLLVYVKVACPFLDIAVESMVLKREYTECAQWNEAVVAKLNAAPPDLTVIHMSHWIFPVDDSLRMGAFQASLARMIGRLSGRTVILADTPHSAMDVPACLSTTPWDIRPCSTRKAQAMSQHGALESGAAAAAGVALIDLASHICPYGPCPAVVDNMIVYRDAHHLTATFSASLGPELGRLIDIVR